MGNQAADGKCLRRKQLDEARVQIIELEDPRCGESWFDALPKERRQGMTDDWKAGLQRQVDQYGTQEHACLRDGLFFGANLMLWHLLSFGASPLSVLLF